MTAIALDPEAASWVIAVCRRSWKGRTLSSNPRGSERDVKFLFERPRVVGRPPLRMAEDELVRSPERGPLVVGGKFRLESGRDRDRSDPFLGLGVHDSENPLQEIHVSPAEGLKFGPTEAAEDEDEKDDARLSVRELGRDASDFFPLQDPPAPPRSLRSLRVLGGIRLDKLLPLRGREDRVKDRDVPTDRRGSVRLRRRGDVLRDLTGTDPRERQRAEVLNQTFAAYWGLWIHINTTLEVFNFVETVPDDVLREEDVFAAVKQFGPRPPLVTVEEFDWPGRRPPWE